MTRNSICLILRAFSANSSLFLIFPPPSLPTTKSSLVSRFIISLRYHQQIPLDIFIDIRKEDKRRMIRYLLSNANLSMKVRNVLETKTFTSNNRAPQGDSFGLVLVTIYFENTLSTIRRLAQNANDILQLAYSYNFDFVSSPSTSSKDVNEIEKLLAVVNLHVNIS